MKSTSVLDVKRTGDFGGTKIKMGIDANSMAHIMSVLTDLYSNPRRAVIREYSTNARDSHIDAGQSRPIEVTLPNSWSPFFKVKDYGLGLSIEDVYKVYSQYGASTKRDSNLVNGMLGLGCKSALTYTSQFTIVSVKDGVKITVVVSRIEDGSAGMEVVDTVATTEPNGVEITVPVKNGDASAFAQESRDFYQYWDKGTVLVDGKEPESHSLKMVTKNIGMGTGNTDYIVMGNVAYRVKDKGLFGSGGAAYRNFNVVAFVDIGEVAFTPSREDLMYTVQTNDTIERLRKELRDHLHTVVRAEVDAASTHEQAYRIRKSWIERLGSEAPDRVTYRGTVIPDTFTFKYTLVSQNYGRGSVNAYTHPLNVSHDNVRKGMIVTNYNGVKITAHHKKKITKFKEQHGIQATSIYLLTDTSCPVAPWAKSYNWEDIKAIPLVDPANRVKRDPTLPVYDPATGYSTTSIPLDKTKTVLYVSPRERIDKNTIKALYKAFPQIQIFDLGENRWDKFKRENPTSDHLKTWVRAQIDAARDDLTSTDMLMIYMKRNRGSGYSGLDTTKIDDKALAEVLSILNGTMKSDRVERYNSLRAAGEYLRIYQPDITAQNNVLEKYPLLRDIAHAKDGHKHMILYVNSVFAARKNGAL